MIRGLDIFRERFRSYAGSLVLIGGAACDDWLDRQGLAFRATKDLDIVLLLDAVDSKFVAAMRQFVEDGGYEVRQRSTQDAPVLYRFAKPKDQSYPYMLEIFSRRPDGIALGDDQTIVPVPTDGGMHSLSAILLDDTYHDLIRMHSEASDGIYFATSTALIPLKAKAWMDLRARQANGEQVDARDITKHRGDVFRLAGTLPGEPGPPLPEQIRKDISSFLDAFPAGSAEWPSILASIKSTLGGGVTPEALVTAIRTYFGV